MVIPLQTSSCAVSTALPLLTRVAPTLTATLVPMAQRCGNTRCSGPTPEPFLTWVKKHLPAWERALGVGVPLEPGRGPAQGAGPQLPLTRAMVRPWADRQQTGAARDSVWL